MTRCFRLGCSYFQHLKDEDGKGYARHACQGGQHHTFRKDLAHNVPGLGTDGPADAYLGGTFLHRNHHDVADSNRASQ